MGQRRQYRMKFLPVTTSYHTLLLAVALRSRLAVPDETDQIDQTDETTKQTKLTQKT